MTTHHSTSATSLNGIFENISGVFIRVFEHRAQKARLASDMKALLEMDSHMLNDIGLTGFNRLPPAQRERVLLDATEHA